MPHEVGKGLQAAQDDIQRVSGNPVYFSFSTDASGAGRLQVIDSNWKVCGQVPAAGTKVTADVTISFASVKLTEDCP
jgi:hypothetical protein